MLYAHKKKIIILGSLIALIFAAKHYRNNYLATKGNRRLNNQRNLAGIDSITKLVKAGDIVFRRGADAISDMFCKMNQKDRTFSHLGIVLPHADSIMVYHSIGGEDNPDEKIRVEPFKSFVTPSYNSALGYIRLPLTTPQLKTLETIVKQWHAQQRTFDMKFDLVSDEKLYCAEFVYKAYRLATKDTNLFSTSKAKDLTYVAPDDVLLEPSQVVRGVFEYQ